MANRAPHAAARGVARKATARGAARKAASAGTARAPSAREAEDGEGDAAINAALGTRIRALRAEKRMTLQELSERSNVSRAMLSKVERGEKSPTLPIVVRIANGFGLPLSTLLGAMPDASEVAVIRAGERLAFRDPQTGFERWVLSPAHLDNGLEFVMHRIPPGQSTGLLPPYAVPTEKYIAVSEGQLTVYAEGRPHVLEAGDALYFVVRSPYSLTNTDGRSPCSYYMVIARKR